MWCRGVLPAVLPAPLSATLSPALWVYLCAANVGPQGLLVVRLPAPFIPHSTSLSPATATRVLSTLVPVSAPPTSLDEYLFSISLVLVPLAVRFSVSSGCARRRSVSTYAAILVLPLLLGLDLTRHSISSFLQATALDKPGSRAGDTARGAFLRWTFTHPSLWPELHRRQPP